MRQPFATLRNRLSAIRNALAVSFIILSSALLCGCEEGSGRQGPLVLWAGMDAPTPQDVRDSRESIIYDASLRRVTLAGAIRETIGFHVNMTPWKETIENLDVHVNTLKSSSGEIPADSMQVFRVHSIPIKQWPGWHIRSVAPSFRYDSIPDVVVPVSAPEGGLPASLQQGENLLLWVEITPPLGTDPGIYTGQIELYSDDQPISGIEISMTVWPFALPEDSRINLLAEVDYLSLVAQHIRFQDAPYTPRRLFPESPKWDAVQSLLYETMNLLREHRLSPVLPEVHPIIKTGADGRIQVNFDAWDQVVDPWLNGPGWIDHRPAPCWPIPFDETFPPPAFGEGLNSPSHSAIVRDYLEICAKHFEERGWLNRAYVKLPQGDTIDANAYRLAAHYGAIARSIGTDLRTRCDLIPQDIAQAGWEGFEFIDLTPYVNIWCTPAQFFDPTAVFSWNPEAVEYWLKADRPPFSGTIELAARGVDTRVLPWQGYRQGTPVVELGTINDPYLKDDKLEPFDAIQRNPRTLIYSGKPFGLDHPVASMRLKRLRQGMQDIAYLELAHRHRVGHLADTVAESLAPFSGTQSWDAHYADGRFGGWVSNLRWFDMARRVIALQVEQSIAGRQDSEFASVATAVPWRELMEATRTVMLETEGVRVFPAGADPQDGMFVEVTLVLRNHSRIPIDGTLSMEDLPIGWTPNTDTLSFGIINPGESQRLRLGCHVESLTWDENGLRELPIKCDITDSGILRTTARLACLTTRYMSRPITLDGNLSDWPVGLGNTASAFLPVITPDLAEGQLVRPDARSKTFCMVARDAKYLYFGIRAFWPAPLEDTHIANVVAYDGLVPAGQEVVEILIDPDQTGTRSPGDLYHIAVKPNGVLWEKGVRLSPPVGSSSLWPADIRFAADQYPEYWEAEIRIPLEAFGRTMFGVEVWGMNFTRFDFANQEYSTWSGAIGNAWDPLSLGNMSLFTR